ncbi:MAG: hypothetical protein PHI03_11190, partial [Bacteroidales bacterium]|nr:hypothetical protein [Bacteroidales bacterium]
VDPADQKLGIDSESIFDYFCGKGSTIKSNPLMYTYTLYGIVSPITTGVEKCWFLSSIGYFSFQFSFLLWNENAAPHSATFHTATRYLYFVS